jgi:hypothetical protein
MQWLKNLWQKLFGKTETPKPVTINPVPSPVVATRVSPPASSGALAYDYTADAAKYRNEYELMTGKFFQGLPRDYDLVAFATAGGRPNPYTHTNNGRFISPSEPAPDVSALTDNGEFDLKPGQTKTVTFTRPGPAGGGRMTWVVHAPQWNGAVRGDPVVTLSVNGAEYTGPYTGYDFPEGTYSVSLVSGPERGVRLGIHPGRTIIG